MHAAAGGAAETVTVDSTQGYLQWAQDNLELNGFSGLQHRFERADVRVFLKEEAQAIQQGLRPRYDLVVLDPPTFSNSKGGLPPFDVRRHHAELFNNLYLIMKRGAALYFSNNAQRFSLHPDLEKTLGDNRNNQRNRTVRFSAETSASLLALFTTLMFK